jgi:hypothetical protein
VNLTNADAGFNRSRLVAFGVALPASTYPNFDQRLRLYQRLIDRFGAMPGVERVSAVSGLPPQRALNGLGTDIDGYTPPPGAPHDWVDYYQTVTSDYFEALGISIVKVARSTSGSHRACGGRERGVRSQVLEGSRPDWSSGQAALRRPTPWVTIVGVAKDVQARWRRPGNRNRGVLPARTVAAIFRPFPVPISVTGGTTEP